MNPSTNPAAPLPSSRKRQPISASARPCPKLPHSTRKRGEFAEMRFAAAAIAHGFRIARPWGDSERYDLVICAKGRFWRVQVKSTSHKFRKAYRCNICARQGSSLYTKLHVDFIAAYVLDCDVWYIIPVTATGRRRVISLFPIHKGRRGSGEFEQYREAWHLLR